MQRPDCIINPLTRRVVKVGSKVYRGLVASGIIGEEGKEIKTTTVPPPREATPPTPTPPRTPEFTDEYNYHFGDDSDLDNPGSLDLLDDDEVYGATIGSGHGSPFTPLFDSD